jgi:site-specific DNA-cytosine methylase
MGAPKLVNKFPPMLEVVHGPRFIVVDLFCGAGGTTIGFKLAKLRQQLIAFVVACVNHDPIAIKSHWINNKEVEHFEEDIRILDLTRLIKLVNIYRAFYPGAKLILWASLECTNFSKAKGGASRDPDSRTLADHLDRYILALNPDYVMIENVTEFMSWGPMRIKAKKSHPETKTLYAHTELTIVKDKKTKQDAYGWEPVSKKNGQDWLRWRNRIDQLGYQNQWKELNSADFGAYTSRNRLFGVFHRPNLPAIFPLPTHAKVIPKVQTLFDSLEKWKPVKEVLNFKNEGDSILNRLKALSSARPTSAMLKDGSRWSTDNINAWLIAKNTASAKLMLAKGKKCKSVILLPAGCTDKHSHHPLSLTIPQQQLANFEAIVSNYLAVHGSVFFYYDDKLSDKTYERVYSGLKKYIAGGEKNFMQQLYACDSKGTGNYSVNQPERTITTRHASNIVTVKTVVDSLCAAEPMGTFISQYNSGKEETRNTSIDDPLRTITTANRFATVQASFISKAFSGNPDSKNISVDEPTGAITTIDHHALVQPCFITKAFSGKPDGKNISVDGPAGTITTFGGQSLVQAQFIVSSNGGLPSAKVSSVEAPARVITTTDNKQLVKTCFISKYYGNGDNVSSIEDPAGTLRTKDCMLKIQPVFLDKQYTGNKNHQSVDQPAGAIMPNDKHCMISTNWLDRNFSSGGQHSSIEVPAGSITNIPKLNLISIEEVSPAAKNFVMATNYTNVGSSIDEPISTITANRKFHYLVNPQFNNGGSSVNDPCFTLIAGMSKRPPYLVVTEQGKLAIEVYDDDSAIVVKIKQFMAMYGISDIKMRMLVVTELLAIQGFPASYHLEGTQADKKKFIGNSVVPHVVRCWAEQMAAELDRHFPELYLKAA